MLQMVQADLWILILTGNRNGGMVFHMTGNNKLPDVFSQHPQVMSGALVFKGTRVPVQTFFDHIDQGGTLEEFLDWYDGVTREQAEAAMEIRSATTA